MAEIDDFDLDKSTAQAWANFEARLAEVLSVMDDSADLTIGTEGASGGPAPYLRFSCPRRDRVRGQVPGNAALGPAFQLTDTQRDGLRRLGFGPDDDDGHRLEVSQEEADRLAGPAVDALRDVYGVQHPVFLAPDQLADVLQPPPPAEPSAPEQSRAVVELDPDDLTSVLPRDRPHLDALVDTELTAIFGHPPWRDPDGDVAARIGSTMLFLRTADDAQDVVVFAAVVHEVAGRSRAAEVLNDLNAEARWAKFQLVRDRVFVSVSILARPFVPAHLHQAVRVLSDVADGIDDDLAVKLGGRTTFAADHPDG